MNTDALYLQTMAPSGMVYTSHPQQIAQPQQEAAWSTSVNRGMPELAHAFQPAMIIGQPPAISNHPDWLEDEERKAYMEATVEQDIAWQIASNRRARNLSQKELADLLETRQSAVARLEDPTYGRHSIRALIKVAHAFDCALRVSLVSYSRLAEEVANTSDEALYAARFVDERYLIP